MAYLIGILWTEPEQRAEGLLNLWLFVYTSPVWPMVLVGVPLLAIVSRATSRKSRAARRAALVLAASAFLGVAAAVVFRDSRWTTALAAGGALFGALYRDGRRHEAPPPE